LVSLILASQQAGIFLMAQKHTLVTTVSDVLQ